jgi:transposase
MDMNASYGSFVKDVFACAKISIDRFHVIQQLSRTFNKSKNSDNESTKKVIPLPELSQVKKILVDAFKET